MMQRRWIAPIFPLFVVLAAGNCGGPGGDGSTDPGTDPPDIPFIGKDTSVPGKDTAGGNHPPVLMKIGDRVVAVGETLEIEAQATDPDGDDLTYSVYGDIPPGAKFNKTSHVFTWVPLQADKTVYLTFVVSDDDAMDRETVEIKVVAEKIGHPPVFDKVSDQKVQAGAPFSLQLSASDLDGDTLEFGIAGQKPPMSEMNPVTGLFTWNPPAELDQTVVEVTFVVSDGVFKDDLKVRFLVGEVAGGSPPEFVALADQSAEVGKALSFTVNASDPEGQSVTLKVESGLPAGAYFDSSSGVFQWTPGAGDAGHTVAVKFSASDGQFTSFLTVQINVSTGTLPPTCQDDVYEPNNQAADAKALGTGAYDLSICDTQLSPVDSDWFLVGLKAGESLNVKVTFEHDLGDIDVSLAQSGPVNTIVAASDGTSDEEEFDYSPGVNGDFLLVIFGVANIQYSNAYHLELTVTSAPPTCQEDFLEPDDSAQSGTKVTSLEADYKFLTLCPGDEDWFLVPLDAGDTVLAAATISKGSLSMELQDPAGKVVDTAGPTSAPATVGLYGVEASGDYRVRVFAAQEAAYSMDFLVEKAPDGCTSMTCPVNKVCDWSTGDCVTDYCSTGNECPGAMPCLQTYCVESCQQHEDCRTDFLCKEFPEGNFCGISGYAKSGAECIWFSQCADERVCLFEDMGGYCGVYGCATDWECPLDAWCVEGFYKGQFFNYCAAECEDEPCPGSSNFTCQPGMTMSDILLDLCLPAWIEV